MAYIYYTWWCELKTPSGIFIKFSWLNITTFRDDYDNWPLNKGWPHNSWPLNKGWTVLTREVTLSPDPKIRPTSKFHSLHETKPTQNEVARLFENWLNLLSQIARAPLPYFSHLPLPGLQLLLRIRCRPIFTRKENVRFRENGWELGNYFVKKNSCRKAYVAEGGERECALDDVYGTWPNLYERTSQFA